MSKRYEIRCRSDRNREFPPNRLPYNVWDTVAEEWVGGYDQFLRSDVEKAAAVLEERFPDGLPKVNA